MSTAEYNVWGDEESLEKVRNAEMFLNFMKVEILTIIK